VFEVEKSFTSFFVFDRMSRAADTGEVTRICRQCLRTYMFLKRRGRLELQAVRTHWFLFAPEVGSNSSLAVFKNIYVLKEAWQA
jgi:hypothetical protein